MFGRLNYLLVVEDNKRYVKPSDLSEGDTVLVRRDSSHKKSATPYDPKPNTVEPHAVKQEVNIDDGEPEQIEFPTAMEEDSPTAGQAPQWRYPMRNSRRPPEYLKDYVLNYLLVVEDNKRYVKPSDLSEGDTVLVRRDSSHKKSATPYDPKPNTVEPHAVKQEVNIDDGEPEQIEFPTAMEEDSPTAGQAPQWRYPMRNSRRPPEYLKDYVCH
ncbi:hypothetical protein AC249_AIPGENE15457 [Exaiptasia diaphana]|nr:hypothetical protein AC249_AIPGENE15457 [Exaiptasia diaphana]